MQREGEGTMFRNIFQYFSINETYCFEKRASW